MSQKPWCASPVLPQRQFREWEARWSAQDTCTDDIAEIRRLFEEKADEIFVSNSSSHCVEYLSYPKAEQKLPTKWELRSTTDIVNVLDPKMVRTRDHIFILSQKGTWSGLQLSLEMFQVLCSCEYVHPALLEIIMSFKFKIREEDEYFTPCSCRFNALESTSYEVFYSVYHVEQHGRLKPTDPWSFRKYAVYQKYDQKNQASLWFFIQPREEIRQRLESGRICANSHSAWASFYTHLKFLKSSSTSWRWYLNYLSNELDRIRVKVICQPDPMTSQGSDEVDFLQTQSLELIQAKARRASSAIETTIMVIKALSHHLNRLACAREQNGLVLDASDGTDLVHDELKQLSDHLAIHVRKARDITENTASINILIQRTLDLRNAFTLHTSNTSLQAISASAATESTSMLHLAALSRHDARIMKVASIIALMYLPAGLVASIFSTELVSLDPVKLDLWKGIIVFLMLLGTLTVATACVAVLWIKRDSKIRVGKKAVTCP